MLLKVSWVLNLLTFCDAFSRQKRIVGGYPALIPEADGFNVSQPQKLNNIISIQDDYRTATITGTEDPEGYYAYKGIRYAEPPTGRLRFQRPVLIRLSGEVDATKYGAPCPQPSFNGSGIIGNEDCLFLNVYTPLKKANNSNLPVLIWIHGGGFYSGSSLQYGPAHIVKNNIIVVTIQYRLGSLGWLTSHLKDLPGNVGLFDMRAAIKWVKEYISYFNGDPERIVLSGQGSGASAATLLTMSDFTKGMISGVFAMSGGPLSAFAVDHEPKKTFMNMTTLLGCDQNGPIEVIRCLQMLSIQKVISSDSKFQSTKLLKEGFLTGLGSLLNVGPAVEGNNDGRFLPFILLDSPLRLLKKNKLPTIPMLTGVNKMETKSEILGKFRFEVLDKLKKVPEYVNKVFPHNVIITNTGLFKNGSVNNALKTIFENKDYLKLVTSTLGNGAQEIRKVMQGTTDALFNLPAFFTSHLWSKRSNAYFYSFEHKSNVKSPGKWFLPNMLDVPNTNLAKNDAFDSNDVEESGEPSHGDDLIYLYDVRTIEGKPIPGTELKDKKDIEMRNNFTSLVAEFVRNGKPRLTKLGDEWPSFTSSKQSDYVILDENARIENKFRFCEMGLWGGVPDILQSSYCNLPGISDILKTVPDLLQNGVLGDVTEGTVNLLENPLNTIEGLLKNNNGNQNGLLGGLTGTLKPKQENKKPSVNTPKPLLGILG
ncbi:Carboxylesterase type B, conserved site,Carboxylesterase, type B,Alpha/Beta hydrolase fold [Cinara cedri]|uniref:Carboxylesterase type B, conserved site,Carboxylesterase, type B,Alpha/Beta hydrolase fold n=1 Tax=Cinara cedri TaxID=506608 RepID=A0A5E4N764_9HEMI|nr:Carboxylesterase type B, conserved site,Carboxylesterase, type B,Alpha/Beta hydrolase fold [Cinara cedri]